MALEKAGGVCSDTQALARQTSVVVVAYESGDFLRDCIASILQTHPEVEIVVVDNASTDGSVEHVRADFPTVQIVRCERNGGFGAGNNRGVAASRGAYLVFLNPDAVVVSGWLEVLVRPLVEDATIGFVTPKVLLRGDVERINVAGLDVHLSGISMCRGLGLDRTALAEVQEVAAISGVATAVRREVFEAVGGFDEEFFLYVEDVDISVRAWFGGYRCLYVPHAVVSHNYEFTMDEHKTFYVERGRYLMLLKTFSWRTLLGLAPALFLAEMITWGWLLWRNPRAIVQKLRAYHWVLAGRMCITEKRRLVQSRRVCPDSVFLDHCRWRLGFEQFVSPRVAHVAKAVFDPLLWSASQVVWLALGQ
jgi:GT2 family glycosyltransferase